MKKCKYYSIMMIDCKIIAQAHDGYTDGIFNYHCTKYNNHCGTWYAIEPTTGLSVTTGNTLKEARQKATAPEMFKAVHEKITEQMKKRFNDLVMEARGNV